MTISERLRRWLYGDDGLDLEIEESIAGEYERTGGMTPECFAKMENEREDKRHALALEEEENYKKVGNQEKANNIADQKKILWCVDLLEKHGIEKYPFGVEGELTLICEAREDINEKPQITFKSNIPVELEIIWGDTEHKQSMILIK